MVSAPSRFAGFGPRDLTRQNRRKPTKALAMPAQERLGLNDLQDLLPIRDPAREKPQGQPLAPRQAWGFYLAVQHDQLLAQQDILSKQFRAAAWEVSERAGHEIGPRGLCEAPEELVRGSGQM